MNGTGTTTFAPNMTTNRSMTVTILWHPEENSIVSYGMDFSDAMRMCITNLKRRNT